MKKIISILLILLLVTVSAHPSLAIHLCGGKITSVQLSSHAKSMGCGMKMDASQCNASESSTSHFNAMPRSCCQQHYVKMATDSFQNSSAHNEIIKNVQMPVIHLSALVLNSLYNLSIHTDNSQIYADTSPQLVRPCPDLLSYICTFRI